VWCGVSLLFLPKAVKAVKIQLFGQFIAFLTYEKLQLL
jgi:hypothetical protein